MLNSQIDLLKTRRFLPLFVTQCLGAFNDNIFKNALVILLTYVLATGSVAHEQMMVTLAAGIFIFPFFIFSATAGQLAEKYDKARLAQIIKFVEILIMLLGTYALFKQGVPLLMTTLFLMGTHSTFFGPIKYAILPDHLQQDELISGNAYIESGTFIAILLGTILGGVLILTSIGPAITGAMMLLVAVVGFISSLSIPKTTPQLPNLKVNWNIVQETWRIIQYAKDHGDIFLSILGISWFFLVAGIFLAQLPGFTKDILHAQASIVSLFLSVFSIGIAIGSMTCNYLLKGEISAKYIPLSILVISLSLADLYFATKGIHFSINAPLQSLHQFLSTFTSWRLLFDMLTLSIAGGIYAVPLYAILQTQTAPDHRSRMIACNNIINSLFMVLSAVAIMVLMTLHITITQIFFIVAVLNLVAGFYVAKLVPHTIIQSFLKWLLISLYRVRVNGMTNYKAVADQRFIIVANHTSFLDAMLIAAFLPCKITFAINTHTAQSFWLKPLLALVDTFPIDPTNPMSTKSLIRAVKDGKNIMIFPEGRITVTGGLMKIYEGPGLIAVSADAAVLPVRIEGAQYTIFSRLRGKVRIRWMPKIKLTLLPSQKFQVDPEVKGRLRRQQIGKQLYELMSDMMFVSSKVEHHLYDDLLEAKHIYGAKHIIAEDVTRAPMNYRQLILRTMVLGRHLRQLTRRSEPVGILLPNTVNTLVTFFALQLYSRVTAMLNYSAGSAALLDACTVANVNTIITSKRFITLAKLTATIEKLLVEGVTILYLEDAVAKITLWTKLSGWCLSYVAKKHFRTVNLKARAQDPAVILFTSGSEGKPKGVVLSHANIQANRFQIGARIDFTSQDIIFNTLPMFHSFGLSTATLLPVLSGIKVFFYPTPLHYRVIPELCYDSNATILFGTDTFLANYARAANPYDFYSLRYVIAGAEKLKESTRREWIEKFGVRVLEGYGATETSPVLACNTPMHCKFGTVGKLLPGISYQLKKIEGITEGGRLYVKGPNIMLGYLLESNPGVISTLKDGWYDTGDIVTIDSEGYITITGRAKRFSKIAGEMVSLSAVEQVIDTIWPGQLHAVVSLPDDKKGEKLVLVTPEDTADRKAISDFLKQQGLSELMCPRHIERVKAVPVTGAGKVDYQATKRLLIDQ